MRPATVIELERDSGFGRTSWRRRSWRSISGIAVVWDSLGHATRLTEGMTVVDRKIVKHGSLEQYILDPRFPLEICLSSNVHTGAVATIQEHPFRAYYDAGFRVTFEYR